jgi:hypothetical protein
MRAMIVEVCPEIEQFVFEIRRRPEQRAIQILASNRADQPCHKGIGEGNIGNGFDLGHLQYPQNGLPLPKLIKGIVVGAEVLGHPVLPLNRAVEHPAKCDTIDGSGMDAEPNDAARVLIHDDQDPVGPQRGRFAPVPGELLVSGGFLHFAILLCSAHTDLTAVSSIFAEILASCFYTSVSQCVERDATNATRPVF